MDFPHVTWPALNTITPFSTESLGPALARSVNQYPAVAAASSWSAVNRIHYYPFRLYQPQVALSMSYIAGGTLNGNVQMGIYGVANNLIVAGAATAQTSGSTTAIHNHALTATLLNPGVYYMAVTSTSGTGTSYGVSSADEIIGPHNLRMEAGSGGLPTTATPVAYGVATVRVILMAVHFSSLV